MIKKLLLLLVVVAGVIFYSDMNQQAVQPLPVPPAPEPKVEIQADRVFFSCDGRQYCSQMTSYEEAKFFLDHCPDTKMDGDNDGIPCERQF